MKLGTATLLGVSGLLLSACNNPLTLENYNKLKSGQTYAEVTKIVGEPARCDETLGIRSCVWGDEQRGLTVNFVAGQALLMSAKNLK